MKIKILEKLNNKIQLNLFKLAHKLFYKEVDDEICNCMQKEVLYEHFDNKIYAMDISTKLVESTVGLILIPILDIDYYKYLRDREDLFISANNKIPINYACASVNELKSGETCVFIVSKKSAKNIPSKFMKIKNFYNIGQVFALVGLGLLILKFNIRFENADYLNNFLYFAIYMACLTPIFLFQNDFLWYSSRYCPNPKKMGLVGFLSSFILSMIFIILLYIINF